MDTVQQPDQDQPQQIQQDASTNQPVIQTDAQTSPEAPHLEQHQGEHMAPAPTSGEEGTDTDASSTEPTPDIAELLRVKQEYEQAQQKIQEQEQVMAQIKRMAEEQQAQAANAQLRTEIEQEVANLLQKSGVEDEDTARAIAERVYGRIDGTRQSYQQQMTEWQQQVEASYNEGLWAATKDGFADYMLQEKGLNPVVLPHLKAAKSQDEMVQIANILAQTQKHYQTVATQNRVNEQEQQRRDSGVDVVTGTNSGPLSSEPLKPGRNLGVLESLLNGV